MNSNWFLLSSEFKHTAQSFNVVCCGWPIAAQNNLWRNGKICKCYMIIVYFVCANRFQSRDSCVFSLQTFSVAAWVKSARCLSKSDLWRCRVLIWRTSTDVSFDNFLYLRLLHTSTHRQIYTYIATYRYVDMQIYISTLTITLTSIYVSYTQLNTYMLMHTKHVTHWQKNNGKQKSLKTCKHATNQKYMASTVVMTMATIATNRCVYWLWWTKNVIAASTTAVSIALSVAVDLNDC